MSRRGRFVVQSGCLLAAALVFAGPALGVTTYWQSYGGVYSGVWEDTRHWTYGTSPEGASYDCLFSQAGAIYYCELSQQHAVNTVQTFSSSTGLVQLTNRVGSLVYLQCYTGLSNWGNLDIENIDVYGPVENLAVLTVRGGAMNFFGNLTNQPSGTFQAQANLNVDGDVKNYGHLAAFAFGSLAADAITDNHRISLLDGTVISRGLFTNPAAGSVGGAGSFFGQAGIANAGEIAAETGTLAVYCETTLTNTGHLENGPNTSLIIDADAVDQRGTIRVGSGGGVSFTGCNLENKSGAAITLAGGTLAAPQFTHKTGATFTGFGGISANLVNEAVIDLYGPSQIVGNVENKAAAQLKIRNADLLIVGNTVNNGTILAVNGKVFFEGTLQNNGTIHMDPSTAVCVGNAAIGAAGYLVGDAGSTFQFMGDFANASTRAADFDLAPARVECISPDAAGAWRTFEVAGRNLGAAPGAWSANFAIGTLAVGSDNWPGLVRLVDDADNHAEGQPEALYVHNLSVAADSALDTAGRPLYLDGTLAVQGTLDLAAGSLVADYASASPLLSIRDALASGSSGGAWDGTGIASSAAAEPTALTALGVLDNADPKVGGKTTFHGKPVDATAVLVGYTWDGDANLDGVVDANDYDVIDKSYLFQPAPDTMGWWSGDFNYDGTIDANDYDLIDKAYLFQTGPLGAPLPSPVPTPEPATVALLALGAAALRIGRR